MYEGKISHNRSVIEHLNEDPKPFISFEMVPPKRGGSFSKLKKVVSELVSFNPPYIDVTSHSSEAIYDHTPNGIRRVITKIRPGTGGICTLIQHTFLTDAVPHILCHGYTREETENFLIDLNFHEIKNTLAIRGDDRGYKKEHGPDKTVNKYASDLVEQLDNMNNGKYLDDRLRNPDKTNFCTGVAGYAEKHFEAPNMEWDIKNLKKKKAAGASYVVTQMLYDNKKYFAYIKKCREAGIDLPIIPGLKILTSKKQLTSIPKKFYVDIPPELADRIEQANDDEVEDIGVEWAYSQIDELINNNVPSVHLYVMLETRAVNKLMNKLVKELPGLNHLR